MQIGFGLGLSKGCDGPQTTAPTNGHDITPVDSGGGGDAVPIPLNDQYVSTYSPAVIPPEIIVTENVDTVALTPPPTAQLINGSCVHPPADLITAEAETTQLPPDEGVLTVTDSSDNSGSESSEEEEVRPCIAEPLRAELIAELESVRPVADLPVSEASASSLPSRILAFTILMFALLLLFCIGIFEAHTDNLQVAKIRYSPIMQLIEDSWYKPIRNMFLKATDGHI